MDEFTTTATESSDSAVTDGNLEKILFEVPDVLEFPQEINRHLKGKLHSVLEQNWHLKRHLDYLDKEVIELRKYRSEHREKCGREPESDPSGPSPSIMSQRIVELSKKNRNLTAQGEAMKTKIHKLSRENDSLRNMVECFRDKDSNDDNNMIARSLSQLEWEPSITTTPGSQQNAQLTNKVIEYRRQNQLLRMELKTSLRALSQEVGDGATPHSVLSTVSGNGGTSPATGWRGRQQQILALQQKVIELTLKLKEATAMAKANHNVEGQPSPVDGAGDSDAYLAENGTVGSNSSIPVSYVPQRTALIQQERKKQEQIDKLTQELEQTRKDSKSSQQELKAYKARIVGLENNMKMLKSHAEVLESKLKETEKETETHQKEMRQLRQDISNQKERERKFRDQSAVEIQDGQKSLQRERSIVTRLQSVIEEKHKVIQKQGSEIAEFRNKLEATGNPEKFAGGIDLETVNRIKEMEKELEKASKAMEAGEKERQSLLKIMQEYLAGEMGLHVDKDINISLLRK